MTGAVHGRDAHQVDALVTDHYLAALLGAHARGADRAPSAHEPSEAIRRTADRLVRDLPRLHPSFLFEEALAARLAEVATRIRHPVAAGAEGMVVPLPGGFPADLADLANLADLADPTARDDDEARAWRDRRPLIIGGALTSAALSIAGAAYVAWRLNRPAISPMARAARAVARTRPV